MRGPAATEAVSDALQRYAERGVFRGFSALPPQRGRRQCRFTWLTRQPMTITYEPRARLLAFPDLLPGVGNHPDLVAELKATVADHRSSAVPTHRRIDARRASVAGSMRRGALSLTLRVRGHNDEYAVQRGLNLVNQLFLLLQAKYPEYLVEWFGFSSD